MLQLVGLKTSLMLAQERPADVNVSGVACKWPDVGVTRGTGGV